MDKKKFISFFTHCDRCLIFAIIAFAIACYFLLNSLGRIGKKVVVEVNGKEIQKIALSGKSLFYEFEGPMGSMKIEIDGSNVSMIESSCPSKVCIGMGKIKREGESIICLPNRTVVKILGEAKEGLDGIAR